MSGQGNNPFWKLMGRRGYRCMVGRKLVPGARCDGLERPLGGGVDGLGMQLPPPGVVRDVKQFAVHRDVPAEKPLYDAVIGLRRMGATIGQIGVLLQGCMAAVNERGGWQRLYADISAAGGEFSVSITAGSVSACANVRPECPEVR